MPEESSNILITGAGGFLGRRLVALAHARGWAVVATVRDRRAAADLADICTLIEMDLDAPLQKWVGALKGVDMVVHAAARAHVLRETETEPLTAFRAANVVATEKIASAAAAVGVRRFVFVSSIGVNGNTSGDGVFTEASPERPVTPYAVSKKEAEAALGEISRKTGLEIAIVRPPLVYGPSVKANFLRLISLVNRTLPVPFGLVHNRRSLIYVDNLADLLLTAATHPKAAGQVFLAADDSVLSTPDLWRELARRLSKPVRLLPIPPVLMRAAAAVTGMSHMYEQLCESLEVDATKAKNLLEWQPLVAGADALSATTSWYLNRHA